eukprot:gene10811-4993_t
MTELQQPSASAHALSSVCHSPRQHLARLYESSDSPSSPTQSALSARPPNHHWRRKNQRSGDTANFQRGLCEIIHKPSPFKEASSAFVQGPPLVAEDSSSSVGKGGAASNEDCDLNEDSTEKSNAYLAEVIFHDLEEGYIPSHMVQDSELDYEMPLRVDERSYDVLLFISSIVGKMDQYPNLIQVICTNSDGKPPPPPPHPSHLLLYHAAALCVQRRLQAPFFPPLEIVSEKSVYEAMIRSYTNCLLQADGLASTVAVCLVDMHSQVAYTLTWAALDTPAQPWSGYQRPLSDPLGYAADELASTLAVFLVDMHAQVVNTLTWAALDAPAQPWSGYKRPLKRADAASPSPMVLQEGLGAALQRYHSIAPSPQRLTQFAADVAHLSITVCSFCQTQSTAVVSSSDVARLPITVCSFCQVPLVSVVAGPIHVRNSKPRLPEIQPHKPPEPWSSTKALVGLEEETSEVEFAPAPTSSDTPGFDTALAFIQTGRCWRRARSRRTPSRRTHSQAHTSRAHQAGANQAWRHQGSKATQEKGKTRTGAPPRRPAQPDGAQPRRPSTPGARAQTSRRTTKAPGITQPAHNTGAGSTRGRTTHRRPAHPPPSLAAAPHPPSSQRGSHRGAGLSSAPILADTGPSTSRLAIRARLASTTSQGSPSMSRLASPTYASNAGDSCTRPFSGSGVSSSVGENSATFIATQEASPSATSPSATSPPASGAGPLVEDWVPQAGPPPIKEGKEGSSDQQGGPRPIGEGMEGSSDQQGGPWPIGEGMEGSSDQQGGPWLIGEGKEGSSDQLGGLSPIGERNDSSGEPGPAEPGVPLLENKHADKSWWWMPERAIDTAANSSRLKSLVADRRKGHGTGAFNPLVCMDLEGGDFLDRSTASGAAWLAVFPVVGGGCAGG